MPVLYINCLFLRNNKMCIDLYCYILNMTISTANK